MYSVVNTSVLYGIDSILVQVETDISDGMPVFDMVGFLSTQVKEARERVRTALKNQGYMLPPKRITINISPASIKKSGSGLDLPIAISMISAMGVIPKEDLSEMLFLGEMSLSGKIHGINGVLPAVLKAREEGLKVCVVPRENEKEARLVYDMKIVGVGHLREAVEFLTTGVYVETLENCERKKELSLEENEWDFSMIHGQKLLRRACEVAVSGMHNFLMVGPPGAGKTMIAKCIPSILPSMTREEQMELSKIYSVCGLFGEREHLMTQRPFRSPHHTITARGLTGGGAIPKPGEISLANHGVLFLDELPEFDKDTLEILRQPMEDKKVILSRASGTYEFPANFVCVAAMNPCNCGYYPDFSRCHCSPLAIKRYLGKISQPLLDRMDICIEAPKVSYQDLKNEKQEEDSAAIRTRVKKVHEIQRKRFLDTAIHFNSEMTSEMLKEYCSLGEKEEKYMELMYEKLQLTARTYHKLLKVARTIADMDGKKEISLTALQEAVCYRSIDKKFWGEEI